MLIDRVNWLGHAGFRVDAPGATIYIDPYRVESGPPADLILVTHGHYDHFAPLAIEALSHEGTWLVGPPAVVERCGGQVAALSPGDRLELDVGPGIEIGAVPAYNTSKRGAEGRLFHPREAGGLGYELRVGGERLYHSGDTDVIPEMDHLGMIDVALLPVSGVYVMTAAEAAEAARRIQPTLAVPMHWGEQVGTRADAEAFARAAEVEVAILDPACAGARSAA